MRIFLVLIIFALAFSGYSAASHAMGKEDCSSITQSQTGDCDHADAAFDKDHSQKHEKNNGKCMDCTNCCASSAAVILHTKTMTFSITSAVFVLERSQTLPQGRIFSLLRPPKTLA